MTEKYLSHLTPKTVISIITHHFKNLSSKYIIDEEYLVVPLVSMLGFTDDFMGAACYNVIDGSIFDDDTGQWYIPGYYLVNVVQFDDNKLKKLESKQNMDVEDILLYSFNKNAFEKFMSNVIDRIKRTIEQYNLDDKNNLLYTLVDFFYDCDRCIRNTTCNVYKAPDKYTDQIVCAIYRYIHSKRIQLIHSIVVDDNGVYCREFKPKRREIKICTMPIHNKRQ